MSDFWNARYATEDYIFGTAPNVFLASQAALVRPGMRALAIADEEPQLAARIVYEAVRSVPLAMQHYAPDGAGTEGVTYWDYGSRYNIVLLSSLETALGWLEERHIPQQEIVERSLVHIPLYICKYTFQRNDYLALVEGATGGVVANLYPAKAEAPYQTLAIVSALVFLCLATFPLVGIVLGGESSFLIGVLACLGGGLVAAPILLALAAWVAAKI